MAINVSSWSIRNPTPSILLFVMLTLAGLTDIHEMNGIKTVLASALNAIALAAFIWAGLVQWPQAEAAFVALDPATSERCPKTASRAPW